MLEVAQLHQEELVQKQKKIWFEEKYKFWNNGTYYGPIRLPEDTWGENSFVSINKKGEVIGYISYTISRTSNIVTGLNIINFTDDIITFGKDLRQALDDIFVKYRFNKINFVVVRGNPIEKSYDMMISKYGGRIVGVQKGDVRLIDGYIYDVKLYEIFRKEYMQHRRCISAY